ncbi:MAG: phosphoribosylanthranilate isomerase [Promethearchaeota archaeon]
MEFVKICGLKKSEEIKLCIEKDAFAVGFIYNVPESPRNLGKQELLKLLEVVNKNILTVIVCKPVNISELIKIMNDIEADLYQIHPQFELVEIKKLDRNLRMKIIVAIKLSYKNKNQIMTQINQIYGDVYGILLDNSEGSGKAFNFNLIKQFLKKYSKAKIILAGGININNVEKVYRELNPYGIDVSSALESEKGIKDLKKLEDFLIKIEEINNYSRV